MFNILQIPKVTNELSSNKAAVNNKNYFKVKEDPINLKIFAIYLDIIKIENNLVFREDVFILLEVNGSKDDYRKKQIN